jgi:DNA-binding winged helix-turn-helix (wHTH) protein/tetratricopeptide (TPR) repeat protein
VIRFDPFELDRTQGLTRAGEEVRLTPKSLAVLWLLADRAGRVVTKDDLLETVWADTAVTDSALATCIQEIRHALDDDARRPRFVETLHRRGYRFVAPTASDEADTSPEPVPIRLDGPLIGRQAETGAVLRALAAARSGVRQICLITGEPGVGKSAIFDSSLAAMTQAGDVAVTWAQCVERYGSGEPFQPLLDAVMRLCRSPRGERVVEVLERYAPMWLAQLPGVLPPRQFAAMRQMVAGASPDRMLRELTYAVEVMAAREVLVVGIEDLHWSDRSTLDWISTVAPRTERARILILATMRPLAPGQSDQPLRALHDTLRAKHLASEVALTGLDSSAVAGYIAARLPAAPGRDAALVRLGDAVRDHTGGNPLFMAAVLDQLVERGIVIRAGDGWDVTDDAPIFDLGVPDTIRPIIERQVTRLPTAERDLLEIASVIDDRFPAAAVSGVAGIARADVESTLVTSESRRFVRASGTVDWPDGSTSPEFAFVHTLYRGVLYDGISPRRRAELHMRIGDFLALAYGDRAVDLAAELALHFEQGHDLERAIRYLQHAGENAQRRSAFREARVQYERALSLLERQPAGKTRDERELDLLMGLGAVIMATSGFGAPEVEAAYSAARSLSQRIGDAPRLFPALWGQWLFYWGRGDVRTADELAAELRGLASTSDDSMRLQALHASWATSFSLGKFADAMGEAAEAVEIYDRDRHAEMAVTYGSHDAGVCARMFAARSLAFLGRTNDALRWADEAVALARALKHPFSTALSLTFRGAVDQCCGNAAGAADNAREGQLLARDQGFGLMLAWCTTISGWAAVRLGDDAGLAQISSGIGSARKSGSVQFLPYLLGLQADSCLRANQIARGMEAVEEALLLTERSGERFDEAELHRLRGELLLATRSDKSEAIEALLRGLDIAREQGAALPALRAAIGLARLSNGSDGGDSAREVLRATRMAIPAGTRVPELEEADALLVG